MGPATDKHQAPTHRLKLYVCLQMLSADDMSDILMQKVKYNGFDPELSEPKELPKEF